ncbi:MAG TPA: hypothetical protein PKD49_03735 [Hyphomicrobium sp.]|nr:hypothetical protein [Hyphomicrobium sp.]
MTRHFNRANGTFDAEPARVVPFPGRTPERLVGVGFRGWLSGFETGDIASWESTWNAYEQALGVDATKPVVLALSQFVRAVMSSANRDIEIYPAQCRGFCRDECLAISVIAGCQYDQRSALCACAAALIGSDDIGDIIARAQDFACGLKSAGQVLSPSSVCSANCPLFLPRSRLQ